MQYATICSNSGTMGTPVAEGIFGQEGVFLSAIFLIPLRVAMWTLGIAFFSGKWEKGVVRRTLTHPCIVAVFLGIVLMLTQAQLPPLAIDCLKTVGTCNAALSMILIGSIMGRMDLKLLWHRDTLYFSMFACFFCRRQCCWPARCWGCPPWCGTWRWFSRPCRQAPPPPFWHCSTVGTPPLPPPSPR